ncbi:hypothetical protein B0A71_21685 [Flavobacterium tructae]|uniref:Uncharacterized protein n=2 Tax=Flavobacterium tructae TaxID=1114873 RepID=A0A1S1JFL7_9FLAO|nr:hypothetical protein BHE19_21905 [Flavobacterium tructae]OXB14395.1 hypothetical protein B0A71_21685 [Flavobacterium tructae]
MKLKTAKFLNFIILSIVLLGCERDLSNEDKEVKVTAPFKSNSLNLKGLPADIRDYITPDTNNNTARSGESGNDLQDAIFATQDIVKTTDSENVTNYSISFIYEDSPENVFYNLVINVLPTGEQSQYILKYTCNPADFPNFKSHNFDFNYFRGATEMGVVTQNTGSFTGKSNSGDDPCPKIFIPPAGSGSNTGAVGGAVGGGGGTPSTSSGFNTTVAGYNVSASSSGGIYSVSVGTTTYYSGGGTTIIGGVTPGANGASGANYFYYFRPLVKAPGTSKKASDCPDQTPPAGYVPVSTASEAIAVIKTKIKISKAQMIYLMNTPEALNLVYSLVYNNPSEEDKNFALAMIDALKEGSVVDLKYRVILDPTFSDNKCLMGVYTQLGGSATFQNYLKKFDGDFSLANLTLSVGIDPKHPNASAVTYQPKNGLIEIKFNPEKLNTPALNIAKNFAHEILHAEMFEKLLALSGKKEIPWSAEFIESIRDDEPKIAEYYTMYLYDIPIGGSISDPQHEYMAQLSIKTIKDILKQYDNTQAEDLYTAIAWWGLMGKDEPNEITGLPPQPTAAWVNMPKVERLRLIDIYINFKNANTPCQQ